MPLYKKEELDKQNTIQHLLASQELVRFLGFFNMATVLEIHDQDKVLYAAYRGQLELNISRSKNKLKVNIRQLRHIEHHHQQVYVKMSLVGCVFKQTYKTFLVKAENGTGEYPFDESFRFGLRLASAQARLHVRILSEDDLLIGSMSFGIHREMNAVADGWYFLLDANLGLGKHMRVQKQIMLKGKKKKYVSPITPKEVTWRTANDTSDANSYQNDLYEGTICENSHLLSDFITTKDYGGLLELALL